MTAKRSSRESSSDFPIPRLRRHSTSRVFPPHTWPSAARSYGSRRRCLVAPLADDPLLSVAASISDGNPIDWDRMQTEETIDTGVLEQLRVLDRIAHLHASRSCSST